MLNKMSLRLRLTVMSIILLSSCCIGLTVILNYSAYKMADVIEAVPLIPSISVDEAYQQNEDIGSAIMSPSENSQAARKDFMNQSIFYMILVVMVGGVLTYIISGRSLKPLSELSSQMKNRTVHNLSEDIKVPRSHDEIAELTCSFNEMTHKLDEAFAMQKRFSQSAAHELRTPLAVLKTKVEVFKKKKGHTQEEYNNLLEVVGTHTNRLSDLVRELLEFTNMDTLECNQTIYIKDLLEGITDELSVLAKDRNIGITLSGDEILMQGNENLLHIAFYNLIENAIKYNRKNGNVMIDLAYKNAHTVVTIKDTGIGIPQDMRELIFEPFFRVDKSRSRQMGGAGLGLSNVKNIIDKHDGIITVSDNSDGGSCFTIIL